MGKKFSGLVARVSGDTAAVWDLHYAAVAAKQRGEDVIVLSAGDPDFATPAGVVACAAAALRAGDTHYTAVAGRDSLRAAIAARHRQKSGQSVTADNVIVTAGGQNALLMAALCLLEAGDEVLVPQPMYVTFEAVVRAPGAVLVAVPTATADGFRLSADGLRRAVTARTRAILFASPCNPTGTVLNAAELAAVAQTAADNDLWLVADEVYADLLYSGAFESVAALPGMAQRTITVGSLSKSFAMSGWRVGWAVAPAAVIAAMEKLALCMLYGLPGFIQEAGAYALRHCADDTVRMRNEYRRRRDVLFELLSAIDGIVPLLPEAGLFLLADVRGCGLSPTDFAGKLYRATGVSVLYASAFGGGMDGFVRLSFTESESILREACRRIAGFVRTLPHRAMP